MGVTTVDNRTIKKPRIRQLAAYINACVSGQLINDDVLRSTSRRHLLQLMKYVPLQISIIVEDDCSARRPPPDMMTLTTHVRVATIESARAPRERPRAGRGGRKKAHPRREILATPMTTAASSCVLSQISKPVIEMQTYQWSPQP